MNNYRVKEVDGKFYPQERFFFFFWDYVKLEDRESRDWFVQSAEANCYDGTVTYLIAKDAWGATHWIRPEFKTLDRAKRFIEEYKKFLERKNEQQKVKYYY